MSEEVLDPNKHDRRPWGSYTVIDEGSDYKVKRIEVLGDKRLSYQRHKFRGEHWYVVAGTGTVTLDGVDHEVKVGEAIDIPLGAAHRMGRAVGRQHAGQVDHAATALHCLPNGFGVRNVADAPVELEARGAMTPAVLPAVHSKDRPGGWLP